jgi:hypothetical protein
MANKAVPKAYTGAPSKGPLVSRAIYLRDRWTGTLEIELAFSPSSPLVVGAGHLDFQKQRIPGAIKLIPMGRGKKKRYREPDSEVRRLIAEIVRTGDRRLPVLPGSSLKGVLRQTYELLTPSCEPGMGRQSCSARPGERAPEVCPACSLFGAGGLAGRISISEGTLVGKDARLAVRSTPTPWSKQVPKPGTYRVYDGRKDVDQSGNERPEEELTWSASGRFRSRLRLMNLADEELGLLFVSLGIGGDVDGPSLRVGGKKYHGFGGARASLVNVRQRLPERRSLAGEDAASWALTLRDRALDRRPEVRTTWEALHLVLAEGA